MSSISEESREPGLHMGCKTILPHSSAEIQSVIPVVVFKAPHKTHPFGFCTWKDVQGTGGSSETEWQAEAQSGHSCQGTMGSLQVARIGASLPLPGHHPQPGPGDDLSCHCHQLSLITVPVEMEHDHCPLPSCRPSCPGWLVSHSPCGSGHSSRTPRPLPGCLQTAPCSRMSGPQL